MMTSVLYVDDEPALLEIGKLFLERNGEFTVDTILSAPAALTQLNSKNYDAIVSDYQMPGMDGIEFLKRVRSSGDTVPFILFTGRGREEIVIQALNEGADFYLQKGGEATPQFTELAHQIRVAVQKRQADASIRDHKRREADILNFLPDAIGAIDIHGVVIAWNRAMEKMTGVRAAEILGKGDYEYALPFYHERRPTLVDQVLREDPDLETKYPLLERDGQILIAEATFASVYDGREAMIKFTATPLYNSEGIIIGAIESVRDITRRKRAEMELGRRHEELNAAFNQLSAQEKNLEQQMNDLTTTRLALQESEEKYRVLIENATECIIIEQGEYLKFVNQRAMEVTGYSQEELLSRPFYEFIHPDDRAMIAARYQHGLCGDMLGVDTFRHVRKDGVVRYMEIRTVPILWHGAPAALNLIMDNTEQKKAEEELRESQVNLTEAMDLAHMASWEYDNQTGMFIFDDRFYTLYGTTAEREGGYRMPADVYFREFIHPNDRDRIIKETGQKRLTSDPHLVSQVEHRIIRRDGEIRRMVVCTESIRDSKGHVIKIHGVNQDVTDRIQTQKSLEMAKKKLNLLNYVTFNDIETQVFVLSGYQHLAKKAAAETPTIGIIEKEEDIVQNIFHSLKFARSYQDLGFKPPQWQNVNHVFLLAISHLDFLKMKHMVMLNNLEILADPMLELVFQIFADNTLTHGKTAKQVTLRYSEGPESITLFFEDDGVGIPEDNKEEIFSPHFQKKKAVGLFLAREILEITGITIAETGEPGKGARFEMNVPKDAYRFQEKK
ncbi:PAS domain S-box protein [Methanoregula sp.]|uniref:PAS domain S-box protein n=1 Tax=Methanoregula sp. TaxID=2052170 RepID=UPI002C761C82|nr:PAS domain S-box protein [Methanoregula sp.]HVP96906.1 PAS domain S-box protein [Methanoregula sp.]